MLARTPLTEVEIGWRRHVSATRRAGRSGRVNRASAGRDMRPPDYRNQPCRERLDSHDPIEVQAYPLAFRKVQGERFQLE